MFIVCIHAFGRNRCFIMGTCGIYFSKNFNTEISCSVYVCVGRRPWPTILDGIFDVPFQYLAITYVSREDAIMNDALYDKYDHYLEMVSMPRGSYNIGNHPGTSLLKTWFV